VFERATRAPLAAVDGSLMLAARIVTALVLVVAVLAALFLLPPWAWGAVALAGIAVAAGEWAASPATASRRGCCSSPAPC